MATSQETISLISLGLIVFCALVLVVGVYELHSLPGRIATQRSHPQTQAIEVCSVLGLLVFPFWMVALIWAYAGTVGVPLDLATDVEPTRTPTPASAGTEPAALPNGEPSGKG